jgi:hypothetical protein
MILHGSISQKTTLNIIKEQLKGALD